jgi:geranylgeranyl pyrophosphate synthase
MVGGQWLDLEAEGRAIDLAELEGIHHQKTGALLAAAARLGGLAAGADSAALAALATYGQALGLAFQIADDILDLTGDSALLGKTAGRDLTLAKATYPALLGLDGARELAWAEADRAIVALRRANLATPPLVALARYAVERDH